MTSRLVRAAENNILRGDRRSRPRPFPSRRSAPKLIFAAEPSARGAGTDAASVARMGRTRTNRTASVESQDYLYLFCVEPGLRRISLKEPEL